MAHGPSSSGDASTPKSEYSYVKRVIRLPVYEYIHAEVGGGLALLAAAVAALIWANTSDSYHHVLETHLFLDLALFSVDLSLEEWINDGLMAIFFFVVALEIKRELLLGQLSTPRRAALPVIAAVGGMVVPVLIYLSINSGGEGMRGWGIPMATDIAFALGILALLGRRAPPELRVLLLGLAVVDDLGAIFVIAVAYTETLNFQQLGLACGLLAVMASANRVGFNSAVFMAALAFLTWVAVLNSGIHATVAGVAIGALTPARPRPGRRELVLEAVEALKKYRSEPGAGRNRAEPILEPADELGPVGESTLERLERVILPWSTYVILPIFALANAGVHFSGATLQGAITSEVTIGVMAGLLIGKVVGITLFPWAASRFGLVELPPTVSWMHIMGVGLLGGVGFTVAIFVTNLAFDQADLVEKGKMGILGASLLAGLAGYTLLRMVTGGRSNGEPDSAV